MIGVLLALVVTLWVGYMIFKNYKAQTVLMFGGIILMVCAVLLTGKGILPAKASTDTVALAAEWDAPSE